MANPTITIAIASAFPEYNVVECNKRENEPAFSVYETHLDPTCLTHDELEATCFLRLTFCACEDDPEKLYIHIDQLRKTAHLSGKSILRKVEEIARSLPVIMIKLYDKARLEFDIEILHSNSVMLDSGNPEIGKYPHTRKRLEMNQQNIDSVSWQRVKVKTISLSPLLILCGEPAYYASEGYLQTDNAEIDDYNKAQVELTMNEMTMFPNWPGFHTIDRPFNSIEDYQEHLNIMKCLQGYWDLPIRVFFQEFKKKLRTGVIQEGIEFDFISRFIDDLGMCGFIRESEYTTWTKRLV